MSVTAHANVMPCVSGARHVRSPARSARTTHAHLTRDGSVFANSTRMRHWIGAWVLAAAALGASGCSGEQQQVAAAGTAPVTAVTTAADAPVPGMEHGDHNAHHGGVVYMYDDMHYEVVLDPEGHHRVYFTDSAREDLPASVASKVTLTVERPKAEPEPLSGTIDEHGESWVLSGRPVSEKETSVRVAFVTRGSEYWIDVPFLTQAP